MSLHEGMDTRRVTSSDREKIMDARLGYAQFLCTRGVAAWKSMRLCYKTRLIGQKFRVVCMCTIAQSSDRSYVTVIHGNQIVLCCLSRFCLWELNLWLLVVVARQTSDLFDKESFLIQNSKWLPSLLASQCTSGQAPTGNYCWNRHASKAGPASK